MLFHSWEFIVFFALFYAVYLPLRYTRFYLHWLLTASYFFYGWWNPLYLLLIVYSTALDYYVVKLMEKSRVRKLWLGVSIFNNLVLLGFFKYGGFVTDNLNLLLHATGIPYALPAPGVLLPVGISFYTFQSMSYTIDYYRGTIPRESSFVRFATFVSLFPQLVAGPIERAKNLLPQLVRRPAIVPNDVSDGLSLFFVGLFKKLVMADYLALYVDRIYAAPELFEGSTLMLATFAFGWQIYFDFSGYTDMARGVARMMGFNLMLNFNNPYLATDLTDFWKRWHISLSSWFKDYLYVPLGGNREGRFGTYRNIFATMVISGLWHGAAWTFVIWGVAHALGAMATRELSRSRYYRERFPKLIKQVLVFAFVTFTWIFFRSETLGDAAIIISRIFSAGLEDPEFPLVALTLCLSIWLYQFLYDSGARKLLSHTTVRVTLMVLMLFAIIFASSNPEAFIYFQF